MIHGREQQPRKPQRPCGTQAAQTVSQWGQYRIGVATIFEAIDHGHDLKQLRVACLCQVTPGLSHILQNVWAIAHAASARMLSFLATRSNKAAPGFARGKLQL